MADLTVNSVFSIIAITAGTIHLISGLVKEKWPKVYISHKNKKVICKNENPYLYWLVASIDLLIILVFVLLYINDLQWGEQLKQWERLK